MNAAKQGLPAVDRWGERRDSVGARHGLRRLPIGPVLLVLVAVAVLLPLVGLAARGWPLFSNGPDHGTISGRVTYNERPVPSSIVIFHNASGAILAVTNCDQDGCYLLPRVRPGNAIITVTAFHVWVFPEEMRMTFLDSRSNAAVVQTGTLAVAASPPGIAPFSAIARLLAVKDRFMAIPERYSAPDTSGLRHAVRRGEQTLDLQLTD